MDEDRLLPNSEIRWSVAVEERADWPLDGNDVVIAEFPHFPVISKELLVRLAVDLGEQCAVRLGTHLHHGDFVVTSNIDTVRKWGVVPAHAHCHECIVGLEAAVVMLEEDPTKSLVVGQLYWSPRPHG